MIEYLGPLLIVLGPICFTLCANLDHFFSLPEDELDDITDLEKEHVSMNLSRIFESVKAESFSDPYWIESFQKYYHKNIKELRDAEHYFRSVIASIRHVKIAVVILGVFFIVIGTMYTVSVNLEKLEDPRDIILGADISLVFFLGAELFFIGHCLKTHKRGKRRFTEIMKSQRLLLTGMFMFGSEKSGEAQ